MTGYSDSTWRVVRAVSAEGARVGFMPCLICGAAILIDPDDDTNRVEQHRAWHASPNDGKATDPFPTGFSVDENVDLDLIDYVGRAPKRGRHSAPPNDGSRAQ